MIPKKLWTTQKSEDGAVTPEQTVDEVRALIEQAGGRREWSDTRDSWLAKAAQRLGITHGRAKSLFYRKVKAIPAHEFLNIRARAEALQQRDEHRRAYIEETRTLAESGGIAAQMAGNIACALEQAADRLEGVKRDD